MLGIPEHAREKEPQGIDPGEIKACLLGWSGHGASCLVRPEASRVPAGWLSGLNCSS